MGPAAVQIGWGFSDVSAFQSDQARLITPADKRAHLKAFIEQVVGTGRPVVLAGASLGAAKAIDFAVAYPEVRPRALPRPCPLRRAACRPLAAPSAAVPAVAR